MFRMFYITVIAVVFFYSCIDCSVEKDKNVPLSELPGADMAFYDLYKHKQEEDMIAAIDNAILFVERLDTAACHPELVGICREIANFKEMEYIFSEAIEWKEKALSMCLRLGNCDDAAELQYELANLYYTVGQYHKSLHLTVLALDGFDSMGVIDKKLECYNLLGKLYYICKDYSMSNKYFQRYVEGARLANDSVKLVRGLYNLSVYTNDMKDEKKTDNLINESILLTEKTGNRQEIIRVYLSAAATNIESGRLKNARELLDTAYKYVYNREIRGLYHYYMGVLEFEENNSGKALIHLDSALLLYENGEFLPELQRCYVLSNAIYDRLGDTVMAYKALQKVNAIEHSLDRSSMSLELFKAENNIRMNAERELIGNRKNVVRMVLLSTIFVLVIIMLTVYIFFKRKSNQIQSREHEIKSNLDMMELQKIQCCKETKMIEHIVCELENLYAESDVSVIKSRIMWLCRELALSKDGVQSKELKNFLPELGTVFFQNLLKEYPDLTINEKRLCALLNKNLTTKEISEITGQSPQTINTARHRLRSKLGVSKDISIQEFLHQFNA